MFDRMGWPFGWPVRSACLFDQLACSIGWLVRSANLFILLAFSTDFWLSFEGLPMVLTKTVCFRPKQLKFH
ncbi:hypothetical protein Hanom_Chr12g01166111 [Helianthus anomalus]